MSDRPDRFERIKRGVYGYRGGAPRFPDGFLEDHQWLVGEVERLCALVAAGDRVVSHVRDVCNERSRLFDAMIQADAALEDCRRHT